MVNRNIQTADIEASEEVDPLSVDRAIGENGSPIVENTIFGKTLTACPGVSECGSARRNSRFTRSCVSGILASHADLSPLARNWQWRQITSHAKPSAYPGIPNFMSILQSHAAFWILALVEVSVWPAPGLPELSEGSPRQALYQRLFFGCLVLVGVAMIPALKLGPGCWFSSGGDAVADDPGLTFDSSLPGRGRASGRLLIRCLRIADQVPSPSCGATYMRWGRASLEFPRARSFSIASHRHHLSTACLTLVRCVFGCPEVTPTWPFVLVFQAFPA